MASVTAMQIARSNYHLYWMGNKLFCHTEREIATTFNLNHRTVSRRLRRGWSVLEAVCILPAPKNKLTDREVKIKQIKERFARCGLTALTSAR